MAHPHPISFYNNLFFILTIWIILLKTSLLRPTPLLEKCVVTPRLEQNEAQIWARCIGKALHRPPHLVFCCFLSPLLLPSSHTSHSPSIMYFLFCLCFIFVFLPHLATYGIFVSQPAMEPQSPAVQVQGLNHWTSREAPHVPPYPVPLFMLLPFPAHIVHLMTFSFKAQTQLLSQFPLNSPTPSYCVHEFCYNTCWLKKKRCTTSKLRIVFYSVDFLRTQTWSEVSQITLRGMLGTRIYRGFYYKNQGIRPSKDYY